MGFSAGAALGDVGDARVTRQVPNTSDEVVDARRSKRNASAEKSSLCMDRAYLVQEPANYMETITCADADKWTAAMVEEFKSLINQDVFSVVKLEDYMRLVDSKWVYKIKLDENNNTVRYKGLPMGFLKLLVWMKEEVSAPVVSKEGVRLALALVAQRGWYISQFDVKTAFLHADLDKPVYM